MFHRDKWYWYTPTTRDMLAEYGRFTQAEIDEDIEVVAWMPLPEPYDEETNFPTSAKWEEVVKSVFIELINDAMDGKYKNYTQPALIQECYEKAILAITNSGISYEKGEESTK